MTIRTQIVPDPPAGTDWSTVVPGEYLWDILSVVATLTTQGGCVNFNPNTAMDCGLPFGGPTSGRVDLPASAFGPGAGPFSVELWIRPTSGFNPAFGRICSICPGPPPGQQLMECIATPGGSIGFGYGFPFPFSTAAGSLVPSTDEWTHYVFLSTGSGGVFQIWENAVMLQQGNCGPYGATIATASTIGGRYAPAPFTFSLAVFDEVAFYHSALAAGQIAAHYAAGCAGFANYSAAVLADHPISYYHLDEPPGATTVNDASGHTHSGIVAETPAFGVPGFFEGGGPRYPALQVTDGSNVVMVAPATTGQVNGTSVEYTWYLANSSSIPTPGTGRVSVAISRLIIPAGYVVESLTGDLEPADQWSEITVWWDDTVMQGMFGLTPYAYHDILIVP